MLLAAETLAVDFCSSNGPLTDIAIAPMGAVTTIDRTATVNNCHKNTNACAHKYTVSQKSIPDIFDCNLKTNYQILIIFGMNIPDTICHQITIQFHTSPNVCFCTT